MKIDDLMSHMLFAKKVSNLGLLRKSLLQKLRYESAAHQDSQTAQFSVSEPQLCCGTACSLNHAVILALWLACHSDIEIQVGYTRAIWHGVLAIADAAAVHRLTITRYKRPSPLSRRLSLPRSKTTGPLWSQSQGLISQHTPMISDHAVSELQSDTERYVSHIFIQTTSST